VTVNNFPRLRVAAEHPGQARFDAIRVRGAAHDGVRQTELDESLNAGDTWAEAVVFAPVLLSLLDPLDQPNLDK
jgi:hypothetical protein